MSHHPAHHDSTIHAEPGGTQPKPQRSSWSLLAVTLAAQILVVLDISVVNTALPSIGTALDLSGSGLQWLVTSYLLTSGGGLVLGGRVADLLSRRTVFLSGLLLFTAASIASGLADSGSQLVVARAAQGLSAALLTPSALSLITVNYDGSQRKTALALWGAVGSLGVAAGVLVGGAVVTWTSWQFIFWINAPIGLAAALVGARIITKDSRTRPSVTDFDLPGAAALIAALAAFIYGLGATSTHGWWSVHTAVMFGASGILVGAVFLTSILLQTSLGFSPIETGLAFLPLALALTAGTVVARHLIGHLTPRVIAAVGLTAVLVGAVLLTHVGDQSHYGSAILPGVLALGLGEGMTFVAVSVTAMAGIPAAHAGVASGFLMTGHEVGAALGVAALSAVASAAGSLASPVGAVDAFSRGFTGVAVMAAAFALLAFWRMPATHPADGVGVHLH